MGWDWIAEREGGVCNVGSIPEALQSYILSPFSTAHIYFPFILFHRNHSTVVYVCMCMNAVWTQYVLDRVISKPELSQVETLLRLRPPGINLSLWKCYCVYACMRLCACLDSTAIKWVGLCAHMPESPCVFLQVHVSLCVCLRVLVCGSYSIPHPAVYRREWKVMEGMERDGPVMT